ncbi:MULTISPECIES: LuxR C-terminal-related transcriptional regulator [unclassified Microbacterium]|uniref:LuxR C-terminal-related transcriptional regulator n=1 Tax=unclassified Microbacterium TaxID=2609290 RepID=UPI00214D0131|nr:MULTISPECIES: LuxR C-terminal-related transcriptional regulator [unclassified Microbacterium]MCR2784195.1 LuxR C-terminal-related transcriptional regulator [Microbacterium sp. zg.B96]MDL5350893.1 LuxR C-terminal-related transcriptional regulator [Microbacterium sp. zg-YB36]WIM14973.1 LuxR C-terminal-related transcriptional regulator [Microbacterium sp. zg-B96]
MTAPTEIESDDQLLARAVADLSRRTRFPVVFAGLEHSGAVHVSAIAGARTRSIEGLVVQANRGLGGASFVEGRPRLALDYRTSRSITHDYDRAILGEGISTLLAVPVMVAGRARGVFYCGSWHRSPVGDVVSRPAFAAAESLATELRVRDEVRRRLALAPPTQPIATLPTAAREELRESYAELRSIAAAVQDSSIRDRLAQLEKRLAALSASGGAATQKADTSLSRREVDVLACCALGSTNAEIAHALGLKEGTVKSYLASAMSKLDASTRHAAVLRARRVGILP